MEINIVRELDNWLNHGLGIDIKNLNDITTIEVEEGTDRENQFDVRSGEFKGCRLSVRCIVGPRHSTAFYHVYGEDKYSVMGLELLSVPAEICKGRVQITTNPTQILDTGLYVKRK